jgi:hypothetical protein
MGTQIGETIYMAPGGGVSTAGTSTRAEMDAINEVKHIMSLEDWSREFAIAGFREQGFELELPLELRLDVRREEAFAVSDALGAALRLPTPARG